MFKKNKGFKKYSDLDFLVARKDNWEKDIDKRKEKMDSYKMDLAEAVNTENISYLHKIVEHMFVQMIAEEEVEVLMNNLREGDIEENVDKYLNIYRVLGRHGFFSYIF